MKKAEAPTLTEILASYPGGFAALARVTGMHVKTLYAFAIAHRPAKFSTRTADEVTSAFSRRRILFQGRAVDRTLLWEEWARCRARRLARVEKKQNTLDQHRTRRR